MGMNGGGPSSQQLFTALVPTGREFARLVGVWRLIFDHFQLVELSVQNGFSLSAKSLKTHLRKNNN